MTSVLSVTKLSVTLDQQTILHDINFSLAGGEILGLVGDSGCGKTTLLNTIAGFVEQQTGDICFNEKLMVTPNHQIAPEHRHIGMIFQDYALFPHLNVRDNIAFGISGMNKAARYQRIDQLLVLLKLEEFAERFPHQLSGGQQQRVAIARALAPQPKLLLLDEPFSNIDARLRQELMLEMRHLLKQLKISAIFVTHNKDEVFTFADKMAVMYQGRLLQYGAPSELCQQPNSWQVADFLQLGSWIPCQLEQANIHTIFGDFVRLDTHNTMTRSGIAHMLIKPQDISVSVQEQANCQITYIGVTEQGYHYHVSSLAQGSPLAVKQLSFYSDQVFKLEQLLALSISPHQFLVFDTLATS